MAPPGGGASEKDLRESSKVDLVSTTQITEICITLAGKVYQATFIP